MEELLLLGFRQQLQLRYPCFRLADRRFDELQEVADHPLDRLFPEQRRTVLHAKLNFRFLFRRFQSQIEFGNPIVGFIRGNTQSRQV